MGSHNLTAVSPMSGCPTFDTKKKKIMSKERLWAGGVISYKSCYALLIILSESDVRWHCQSQMMMTGHGFPSWKWQTAGHTYLASFQCFRRWKLQNIPKQFVKISSIFMACFMEKLEDFYSTLHLQLKK